MEETKTLNLAIKSDGGGTVRCSCGCSEIRIKVERTMVLLVCEGCHAEFEIGEEGLLV